MANNFGTIAGGLALFGAAFIGGRAIYNKGYHDGYDDCDEKYQEAIRRSRASVEAMMKRHDEEEAAKKANQKKEDEKK